MVLKLYFKQFLTKRTINYPPPPSMLTLNQNPEVYDSWRVGAVWRLLPISFKSILIKKTYFEKN